MAAGTTVLGPRGLDRLAIGPIERRLPRERVSAKRCAALDHTVEIGDEADM